LERDLLWNSFKEMMEESEYSYLHGDYKKAFLQRLNAKEFITRNTNIKDGEAKFRIFIKSIETPNRKYDLIQDYLTKIDDIKKEELCKGLENLSKYKFESRNYKGAIRALRRSEKYY